MISNTLSFLNTLKYDMKIAMVHVGGIFGIKKLLVMELQGEHTPATAFCTVTLDLHVWFHRWNDVAAHQITLHTNPKYNQHLLHQYTLSCAYNVPQSAMMLPQSISDHWRSVWDHCVSRKGCPYAQTWRSYSIDQRVCHFLTCQCFHPQSWEGCTWCDRPASPLTFQSKHLLPWSAANLQATTKPLQGVLWNIVSTKKYSLKQSNMQAYVSNTVQPFHQVLKPRRWVHYKWICVDVRYT